MPQNEEMKIEENTAKPADVVEKRIKPTIIRRRKVQPTPEEEAKAKALETAAEEAEAKVEADAEVPIETDDVEEKTETKAHTHAHAGPSVATTGAKEVPQKKTAHPMRPVEEKRKSLTIIAQPKEKETDQEKTDASKTAPVQIREREKDIDVLIGRPAKKKKSKDELNFEDIQKHGGLKQYAQVANEEPVDPAAAVAVSRVFEPGLRQRKRKATKKGKKTEITEPKAIKKIIKVSEGVSVSDLSQSMGIKANEIIKKLMGLGIMATVNQMIDPTTAALIAGEYGYEVENVSFKESDHLVIPKRKEASVGDLPRPPVVTVMGHVDHGKTSILDIIRKSNVADGEAGGITQHIGAYTVIQDGKQISFVDTPGHEAFTHMRARGAQVTDIVILVVAADDGVMPQTKEAIDHARAAGVPIIVALNKIDKPNADQDRVKRELSECGLQPEDWGGQTICVPTSAKTKTGIDHLLEMVLLQAEVLELKARRDGRAEGIVIESRMDKRRGPIVTAIVKAGTLKRGDPIVSGSAWGKARLLQNYKGEPVDFVLPSQPVEILGLSDVPEAGERFVVVEDEKTAKVVAENRIRRQREESLSQRGRVTLADIQSKIAGGEAKELNIIIKTDVKGVSDAVKDSLPGLSTNEVKIRVIHTGVGGINESDVMLASASDAVILGFNVVPDPSARDIAEREGVEIKKYSIIYEMLEDVKRAVAGLLTPREVETVLGRAEVRQTFKVPKAGTIAGCSVTSGKITRNARVRLLRDNVIIHDGKISSLRRFKDDAKEVTSGQECGIGIDRFQDVKNGDEIEAYLLEQIAVTWQESKDKKVVTEE